MPGGECLLSGLTDEEIRETLRREKALECGPDRFAIPKRIIEMHGGRRIV
jgi:hypothetical protein